MNTFKHKLGATLVHVFFESISTRVTNVFGVQDFVWMWECERGAESTEGYNENLTLQI